MEPLKFNRNLQFDFGFEQQKDKESTDQNTYDSATTMASEFEEAKFIDGEQATTQFGRKYATCGDYAILKQLGYGGNGVVKLVEK